MTDLKRLRQDAVAIFNECVAAADPERAVMRNLRVEDHMLRIGEHDSVDLSRFTRITVLGAGKASAAMARAVENLLGDRVSGGLVVVKRGYGVTLRRVDVVESGHPVPTKEGEAAAARMVELAESLGESDLVIGCFSGGGSALLTLPAAGITLDEKIDLTEKLLASGADIFEMNAVRKHISQLKGGRLMERAYPATVVNAMLSDVIGDDPSAIASGPFAPDQTTFDGALAVLEKYGLVEAAPAAIVERLTKGRDGKVPETPKQGDPVFDRVRHVVIGSNFLSLKAGLEAARRLGYRSAILSSTIRGDTEPAAKFHAYLAEEIRNSGNPLSPPACLLSGGETTVRVAGDGLGGRNQHFVLSLVEEAAQIPECVFLSAGTDGTDGPTDVAGAMVDSETWNRASERGVNPREYLTRYDSYHFFKALGDLFVTGPTLTNVMDVHLVLVG
ncbi:MAG: glycerate kinase type-2 family protein [Desulfomonilaceae bacterium]